MRREPLRGRRNDVGSVARLCRVVAHFTLAADERLLRRTGRSDARPPLRDGSGPRRPARRDRTNAAADRRLDFARLGASYLRLPFLGFFFPAFFSARTRRERGESGARMALAIATIG